jgi:OmpA-OmpF porin, OOP family
MNTSTTKWLFLLLAWMALGTFLCYKYICKQKSESTSIQVPESGKISKDLGIWELKDGNFGHKSKDFYRFGKSSSLALMPLGVELDQLNGALTTYVKGDEKKGLNVVGYYKSDETNDNTFYENLGLSRANSIKQILVNLGVPAKQISTAAQLIDGNWYNGDTLLRGGDYTFFALADNGAKLSELKTKLQANPIILYFKVNSNELDLSADQQQQFSDMIFYLDNVADARVEVSGHTDNDGRKADNITLSKERAAFVKTYLNTKGNISPDRMDVTGYGPDKPIASNKTVEGKAQNRRVEVVLK